MHKDAKAMGAEDVAEDDTRMFCKCCFIYWSKINTNHRRSCIGWGAYTEDRCWYREEAQKYLDDEKKKGEKRTPNPAWGDEKMKPKIVHEVNASDEEKEKKEKEKQDGAGSSKDVRKEKKAPTKEKKGEKKPKKETKEKKRRSDDSSEIEATSQKQKKEDPVYELE